MKTATAKNVLVVDDNHDLVDALSSLLQVSGYGTSAAHNGYDACDAARAHMPNVVIMDLGMPWMDGFQAARNMRKLPGGDKLQMIAVSGMSGDDTARQATAAGFDRHFTKPLNFDRLSEYLGSVA